MEKFLLQLTKNTFLRITILVSKHQFHFLRSSQWLDSDRRSNNCIQFSTNVTNSKGTYQGRNLITINELNTIYPEQQIEITTCGELYKKWKLEKKYRRIPNDPLRMVIKYIDTSVSKLPECASHKTSPVIFAMHGVPGNYGVFSHLINHFGSRTRVIVPTFPSSLYYPTTNNEQGLFRHSVHEKTQVYQDFLTHLGIPQIDVLVAHSSGVYPCLKLSLDESNVPVKSLALLHPGGYHPVNAMKPVIITTIFSYIGLNRSLYPFIIKHSRAFVTLLHPEIHSNVDDVCLLAITMTFSEYRKADLQFNQIRIKEIPTLMVFSERDIIVNKPVTDSILKTMQCNRNDIWHYDTNGAIKSKGCGDKWLKAVSFDTNSHYLFRKYPQTTNILIEEHLEKVVSMK